MNTRDKRIAGFVLAGLLVALLCAGVVSSFASSSPDGLERVATDEGFDDTAQDHALSDGPMADYSVRGVDHERLSTGIAGVAGVLATFAVTVGIVVVLRRIRRRATAPAS